MPEDLMESNHGVEGWWLKSDCVRAHVTADAGMMAPVEFKLGDRTVSPYSLSPWKPDELDAPHLAEGSNS